ncbi:hypothetical protein ACFOEY_16735 [Paracandidimonas soli]
MSVGSCLFFLVLSGLFVFQTGERKRTPVCRSSAGIIEKRNVRARNMRER